MEKCDVCEKTFKDKSGLAGHMRFSHPSAPSGGLKELSQELATLRQDIIASKDREIAQLRDKLEQVRQEGTELPSFDNLVAHAETCPDHRKQLQAFIDNLPKPEVVKLALKHKIIPQTIRIDTGV